MAHPWFQDPNQFGAVYGGIGGSLCGVLGGTLGALAARLGPQGKYRRMVIGGLTLLAIFGVISLIVGTVAIAMGQPYAIWYPLVLLGAICSLIIGLRIPSVRKVYVQAEARKLEAASFRKG